MSEQAHTKPNRRTIKYIVLVLVMAFIVAVFFSRELAQWIYEVDQPSRRQMRKAVGLVFTPVSIPLLAFTAYAWWDDRRAFQEYFRKKEAQPSLVAEDKTINVFHPKDQGK